MKSAGPAKMLRDGQPRQSRTASTVVPNGDKTKKCCPPADRGADALAQAQRHRMERRTRLFERHARRGEHLPHPRSVTVQLDVKVVERAAEPDELVLREDHCEGERCGFSK